MIISHKYRFIFIKTHKTAGSSIETLLSPLCGPDDILTTMDPPAPGHNARNWIGNYPLDRLYMKYLRARKIIHRDSMFLHKHYYQHMPASRVRKLIGHKIWDSYFKFCFERNPWDKVVSFYWWKMRGHKNPEPFSFWLRHKKLPVDSELYYVDGKVAVDCIGNFEHLNNHLHSIFDHIGIDTATQLPEVKTGIRKSREPYTSFYNEEERQFIHNLYAREINLLGYEFGKSRASDALWMPQQVACAS